jgi:hypothetical protein
MLSNNNAEIQIYKGNTFFLNNYKKTPVVITFDLDETLGSLADLEILWRTITSIQKNITIDFNSLLDLYPEFLRYGILNILEVIYHKKKKGFCDKVFIYTNNQCSPEWCKLIAKYFDYKLKTDFELFDKIICAFKIDNKVVEIKRTTHNKSHNDFINCTLLPKKTKICFVDNTYFYEMNNDRVYYIQPLSYFHNLSSSIIINRFLNSEICKYNFDSEKITIITDLLQLTFLKEGRFNIPVSNHYFITDILVSQKMMYYIKEYFFLTQKKNRTKKIKYPIGKFTRKKGMKSPN